MVEALNDTDDHIQLLISEVNHRANNLLSVIRGIILMSQGEGVDDFRTALTGRLDALSVANTLVASNYWRDVELSELVHTELHGFPRIRISGEPLSIKAKSAQNFGIFLHELATNAQRYGALSQKGFVDLHWETLGGVFQMSWAEHDGPAVTEPTVQRLGMKLIRTGMRQFGGEVVQDWRPEGLLCTATCQTDRL